MSLLQLAAGAMVLMVGVGAAQAQVAPAAEPYVWKSVKIGAGGFVTGIVFSPVEAGLAYCRTDIGGAYRLDTGVDAAGAVTERWTCMTDWVGPRNANLGGCESVAADPVDAAKVYLALGTYSRSPAAIARSGDRGKTFLVTMVPFSMGGNEDGRGMGERLAVDPADGRVLYFGSRRDGLWRSGDGAVTWEHVDSFPMTAVSRPATGGNRGGGNGTGAPGITWVLFDRRGEKNEATRRIYAGVATGAVGEDAAAASVFQSADGGKSWQAVAGSPKLMPARAVLDDTAHVLYVTFGNGPGPNNVTAGAVYKYEMDSGKWMDITPNNPGDGGYGGIAIDRQHAGGPAVLMVSTIDHWRPADAIFRSVDGGASWTAINATADRRTGGAGGAEGTPYMANLLRGHAFDWWLAALAIDPFDSNHVMYGTGATIWGTHDMTDMDAGKGTTWRLEAEGIEETAVLALASPPWGAHLISGVGDIGGFTHEDFAVSPVAAHVNPMFSNTTSIEFAELKPVVVRTGTANRNGGGQTAAYSEDGGITWRPVMLPGGGVAAAGRGGGGTGGAYLTVSADGMTLLTAGASGVSISKDKGVAWTASTGLPNGARPFADRIAPATFYALDVANAQIYTSIDGGATFTAKAVTGLPTVAANAGRGGRNGGARVKASFAKEGEIWTIAGGSLYRSTDGGEHFGLSSANITVNNFSFGKPAPTHENPVTFATGTIGGVQSIFRSDDNGGTWVRINDDRHQYGGNPSVIAGDPRIYGRVYIGMNGRGVLYGEIEKKN